MLLPPRLITQISLEAKLTGGWQIMTECGVVEVDADVIFREN